MDFKALFLAFVGAVIALFYALESLLFLQANGLALPFFTKLLLCVFSLYVFWRNVRRIRRRQPDASSDRAA